MFAPLLLSVLAAPAAEAPATRYRRLIENAFASSSLEAVDDRTVLRRLYLDLAGTVPPQGARLTPRTARQLVDSTAAAETWGRRWTARLVLEDPQVNILRANPGLFEQWMARRFAEDRSWAETVTELVASSGAVDEVPPVSFLLAHEDPETFAASVARYFLGQRIECAQCHDHPYEKLTQREFYGFAAFFSEARRRRTIVDAPSDAMTMNLTGRQKRRLERRMAMRKKNGRRGLPRPRVIDKRGSELTMPDTDDVVPARFLTGAMPEAGVRRRRELARLMTQEDNPWFGPAIVNRTWATFMGRGLVEPVDELGLRPLRSDKPNEALLLALAAELRRRDFRLKPLIVAIVSSRPYRSRGVREVRPLTSEQLAAAIIEALDADRDLEPRLVRAIDRTEPDSVSRHLMMMNSRPLNRAVSRARGSTAEVFARAMGRPPSFVEAARLEGERAPDVLWAVLGSTEFSTNY